MTFDIQEVFWEATLEEMTQGYREKTEVLECLICGECFEKGRIYTIEDQLYEARRATELHIKREHGSVLDYILSRSTQVIGVTEIQKQLLALMAEGKNDKEIAMAMGIHASTVRNHRYRLREKEKQAKLFLTLMRGLEEHSQNPLQGTQQTQLLATSLNATMVDDRYDMTEAEKEKIIKTHFHETGRLKNYPAKEKRKIVILEQISQNFKQGKLYSEAEMNRILTRIGEDHVTLRRALIEYGFVERSKDGTKYWLKK